MQKTMSYFVLLIIILVTFISAIVIAEQKPNNQVKMVTNERMNAKQNNKEGLSSRLEKSLNDGIITIDQKKLVEQKAAEIKYLQDVFYDTKVNTLTQDERVAYIKDQNQLISEWEVEHNIPSGYLSFLYSEGIE